MPSMVISSRGRTSTARPTQLLTVALGGASLVDTPRRMSLRGGALIGPSFGEWSEAIGMSPSSLGVPSYAGAQANSLFSEPGQDGADTEAAD